VDSLPDQFGVDGPGDILPNRQGIFSGTDQGRPPFVPYGIFTENNGWSGLVNGVTTGVWAGASGDSPNLGMLVIATYNQFLEPQTVQALTAPSYHGSLAIIAGPTAPGSVITGQAADGTAFAYNLLLNSFVTP
jgi:hypothetical protein